MHIYPIRNNRSINPDCSGFVQMSPTKKISIGIPVDQFFSQPQNLRDGVIDTSPLALENPHSVGHIFSLGNGHSLPSDMSESDCHDTVLPRDMQSPSELQVLSRLRPAIEEVVQSEVNDNTSEDVVPAE